MVNVGKIFIEFWKYLPLVYHSPFSITEQDLYNYIIYSQNDGSFGVRMAETLTTDFKLWCYNEVSEYTDSRCNAWKVQILLSNASLSS